ncbi:hypothetical protein BDB00DRAFT_95807 [Zychaea mexicana]|uniref:uncharacterized protein n=1 Tax=Zychaea mexicana TaxID=64656 RepID=UPI0022FE9D06|nr:uncharacterized protein BDB00DRAFT_95807 [Zychaea mexicana]KAI9484949.1 hypothetical protein BDB00DRAFT_95807 [Zychaea mexicana]
MKLSRTHRANSLKQACLAVEDLAWAVDGVCPDVKAKNTKRKTQSLPTENNTKVYTNQINKKENCICFIAINRCGILNCTCHLICEREDSKAISSSKNLTPCNDRILPAFSPPSPPPPPTLMDSEESFLHGLPTYTPACLRLTNVLMERIVRLLPTQADRYQACLMHRVWTTAAINILWEWPLFAGEGAIRSFINTIRVHKRLALAVRHLNLCLDIVPVNDQDDDGDAFTRSMRITLHRHEASRDSPLAAPSVITTVLQQCERIETLTVYGWQLDASHLRLIASYIPQLQALQIVGSPECAGSNINSSSSSNAIILPPIAFSLKNLHLYADYLVSPTRYMELESLRVSLRHRNSLDKLCHGHQQPMPKVREVMLANAGKLHPQNIDALFRVFPQLLRFAIEDVKHPIATSRMVQSTSLKHLIIRATIDDDDYERDMLLQQQQQEQQQQQQSPLLLEVTDDSSDDAHPQSHLCRIFIENCRMEDENFGHITFNSDCLTHIKLHNCPSLTDECIKRLCDGMTPLEDLEIVDCIHIGNPTIRALTESPIICTLRRLQVRSSGHLQPIDVFEFINAASSYELEYVAITGYPDISSSFLGRYSNAEGVVLDKAIISALVQHSKAPKDRILTSNQVVKLARALNLDVHHLEYFLDEIQNHRNSLTMTMMTRILLL